MSAELEPIPGKLVLDVNCGIDEFTKIRQADRRRLFLYGEIESIDFDSKGIYSNVSLTSRLVEQILEYNLSDQGIPPEKREPIILYINSPGGEITEGFALLEAIEISKTPVYTVNMGEWCSMAFLIGIAGHKRFSLPNMTFLMHEGTSFAGGSAGKMQDRAKFNERFKDEVIKAHVLKHSNMKSVDYESLERVEVYMLPEDALERGFIDAIVADIDDIL